MTLVISLAAMVLAAPLGLLLALVRLESRRLRPFATAYVEIVRRKSADVAKVRHLYPASVETDPKAAT